MSAFGVVALADRTCELRADGTVPCWGSNRYGETDAPDGQFTDMAAGDEHTCGLRTDGTITY